MDSYRPDLEVCTIDAAALTTTSTSTSYPAEAGQCASGDCTSRKRQCQQRAPLVAPIKECPGYSDQCTLVCQGKEAGVCAQLGLYYIDGTPCGYRGKCVAGYCVQSDVERAISWFQAHSAVGLALGLFVGTFVLLLVRRCVTVYVYPKAGGSVGTLRGPFFEVHPGAVYLQTLLHTTTNTTTKQQEGKTRDSKSQQDQQSQYRAKYGLYAQPNPGGDQPVPSSEADVTDSTLHQQLQHQQQAPTVVRVVPTPTSASASVAASDPTLTPGQEKRRKSPANRPQQIAVPSQPTRILTALGGASSARLAAADDSSTLSPMNVMSPTKETTRTRRQHNSSGEGASE